MNLLHELKLQDVGVAGEQPQHSPRLCTFLFSDVGGGGVLALRGQSCASPPGCGFTFHSVCPPLGGELSRSQDAALL